MTHDFSEYGYCMCCGISEVEHANSPVPCTTPPQGVDVSIRERRARAIFEPIVKRVFRLLSE